MIYHYTTRLVELFPEFDSRWTVEVPFGYMGVCVFFLLSGYLSLKQYKDNISLKNYLKSKFIRLYPSYWCAVIITFFVTKFFLVERSVSTKTLLVNMTMLESFVGATPVDGAYWTLANELIFYAFIALVLVLLKQKSKFSYWALGWVIIANIVVSFETNSIVYSLVNKLLMAQYAHMFLAGGFIYCFFYSQRIAERVLNVTGWLICIVTQFRVFSLGYGCFFLISNFMLMYFIHSDAADSIVTKKTQHVLKPLTFIASISYPLYLIHQNIGYAIMVNISKMGILSEAMIIIPIVVVMLIAYYMHILIEKPMQRKH